MVKRRKYDKIYFGNLLAYYGSFLTQKQQSYLRLYYQEDYSLQEIAENYEVTRVAIHQQIQNAQKKMLAFERALHVVEIEQDILPSLERGASERDWAAIDAALEAFQKLSKERAEE